MQEFSKRARHLLFFVLIACGSSQLPAVEKPPAVYLIGDSTMANKRLENENPERGWGQLLPVFFAEGVMVQNHAKDGRSSRSFFDEGLWSHVVSALQPGDWVVIQFGHNDQKKDKPLLYTDPHTDYRMFLTKYVEEARGRGAQPILVTSIFRRAFTADGKPKATLGLYPEATRQLAAELAVPLVDLNKQSGLLLEALGIEKSKELFLHVSPGELPLYPQGRADNTHLSKLGAIKISGLFAQGLRAQRIPLARWLLDEPKTDVQ